MAQVGGYLTAEECAAFKQYAGQFHLKESGLANLLLTRELRLRRLGALKQVFVLRSRFKHGARARVTAHQSDEGVKIAFEALAREVGICPDQAAAILYRAELSERWLEKSIEYGRDESD